MAGKKKSDKAKAETSGKEVVDISSFFTTTREKNGVWLELGIEGVGIGIEVKVLGPSAPAYIKASVRYTQNLDTLDKITDKAARRSKETDARVDFLSSIVTDLRTKKDFAFTIKGKPLVYSKETVREIFYESAEIRDFAWKAVTSPLTFMDLK